MDNNGKELVKRGDKAFSRKQTFDGLCQALAEQFYPERAQFTTSHDWGEEFAEHLFDSMPVMVRRDLGNAFSSMLRPRGQPWFTLSTGDEDADHEARVWLDSRTEAMREYLYDHKAKFVRATKEGDHDYATFGNAILTVEERPSKDGLLFRCHHMKDCAWVEDMNGDPDTIWRNVSMTARQMKQFFGKTGDSLHRDVEKACEKEPDKAFKVRHIMMPAEDYELTRAKKAPKGADWVSLYVDCDHQHLIREASSYEFRYVVPRWQTISGSPYAVSPAAMTSLPDARTLQAMARVMLEAAEKAVDPPMKAQEQAVRGEINLHGGGITWVDAEYDERLGPTIEPLVNPGNVGLGVDMMMRVSAALREAWYLTKLNLPQQGDRTAYETAQLVEEFIRASIPLFEPMETEYNARLLDMSAQTLLRLGALGPTEEIPDTLAGQDIEFSFSNPLQDAINRNKVMQFQGAYQVSQMAREMDPEAAADFDVRKASRDAIEGSGAPSEWLTPEEEAEKKVEDQRQAQAVQQGIGEAAGAGQAAESVGKGLEALRNVA